MKRLASINSKKEIVVFPDSNEFKIQEIENAHLQIEELYRLNINIQNLTYCQNQINQFENSGDLLRLLNEYLNLSKTFLFHWESLLKNKFGKNSTESKNFKKATNIEYDSFLSYKFLYELRNYFQHCKFTQIKTSAKLNSDNTVSRKIIIEGDSLDEDFKWEKFSDIKKEDFKNIDLILMINENMESLYRIHNISLNDYFDISKLFESATILLKYEDYIIENENFAIIEYKNFINGNFDGMNIHIIDFKKIKELKNRILRK